MKAGSIPPAASLAAGGDAHDEIKEQKTKAPEDEPMEETASAGKRMSEAGSEKLVKQGVKPGVTLTLTVDPSSDPDKLEKQLKLLRDYGMI